MNAMMPPKVAARYASGRVAPYTKHARTCDWCGCDLPTGPYWRYDWKRDPYVIRFRSVIDGMTVRAQVCDEHRRKLEALMER